MSSSTVLGAACEAGEQALIALTPDDPVRGPCEGYLAATAEMRALRLLERMIRRHGASQVLQLLDVLQLDKLLTAAAGRRP